MQTRSVTRAVMWAFIGLLVLLAVAIVIMLTFDWNRARGWIGGKVSEATGREVIINGDLSLKWTRPTPNEVGLARWVPMPRLVARDVTMSNETWASEPLMARVDELAFLLRPVPLLHKDLIFREIAVASPAVHLQRLKDGRNNWTFKARTPSNEPSPWRVQVENVVLKEGHLTYDDAQGDMAFDVHAQTLPETARPYGIGFTVKGRYHKGTIDGGGRGGAVLALQDPSTPYPVEGKVKIGSTHVDLAGTLSNPAHLTGLDMRLKVAGQSMSQLYPLTGITLPDTPPYSTEGRLIGTLASQGGTWKYENFTGRVGGSDLSGTIQFAARQPRPQLTGTLVSKMLRFEDLGPLIGADSAASKAAREAPPQPVRRDKVLPAEPFRVERWDKIDADVRFTGERIVRDAELPIDKLTTHVILKDGVLTLDPLNFGVAGGNFVSKITLDSGAKPIKATLRADVRHLQLKQLFPKVESMRGSFGQVNGDIALSSQGDSVATLLGGANGEMRLLVNQGQFSKFLLEAAGLNVANVVATKLFGDKQVKLNCLASDLVVRNGVAATRNFLFDTEDAFITVDGTLDFKTEKLDLTVKPEQKGVRIISLRAPLYVRGTLGDPAVSVNAGVVALKAGGAVALALVAPITAILPLTNIPTEQASDCKAALARVAHKSEAPPAGQRAN
ncbi:MAG: AsmA family protein [Rhodocyclaceae bacterium]